MNVDLILKYDVELSRSLPIIYEGINIYPVLFKDKREYDLCITALTFNPIYYPDPELSSLPRLYFITSLFGNADNSEFVINNQKIYGLLISLYALLRMVLRDQKFEFIPNESGRYCLYVYPEGEEANPVVFNSKKFDALREIILIQNDTDYDDEYVHPDIKKWIEEQKKAEQRNQKTKTISTIEDQIESMMIEFKNPDESFLNNMTIRRVNKLYEKIVNREIYNAQMSGMMSGMVQFKEQPISWTVTKSRQTDFEKYLKPLN